MPPESWLVITVAAAFLLLGIAGSPLAWAMLSQRRSRSEQLRDRTASKLAIELRWLDERLSRLEMIKPAESNSPDFLRSDTAGGRRIPGVTYPFGEVKGRAASSSSLFVSVVAGRFGPIRHTSQL